LVAQCLHCVSDFPRLIVNHITTAEDFS
jgi:hypothetical protein